MFSKNARKISNNKNLALSLTLNRDFSGGHNLVEILPRIATLREYVFSETTKSKIVSNMSSPPGRDGFIVFLSFSNAQTRAIVVKGMGKTLDFAWGIAEKNACEVASKKAFNVAWVKADIVNSSEVIKTTELEKRAIEAHYKYFFRKGIAFDENFSVAFLEAEVNSNKIINYAIINYTSRTPNASQQVGQAPAVLNLRNINNLQNYYGGENLQEIPDTITLFTTVGFFIDENGTVHDLYIDGANHGRRVIDAVDAGIAKAAIMDISQYLYKLLQPNGKFIYGCFPIFSQVIDNYNMLRHAGTLWSLINRYRMTSDETLVPKLNSAIDYLLKTALVHQSSDIAYIVEVKAKEIKLGGNGLAIVMLTEYMDVFKVDKYIDLVRNLANGILELQDPEKGSFYHILDSNDFSRKEEFRTVYYDGEAAFGLTRAYTCTRDLRYLDAAKLAVENFIAKKYARYRDHWVAYALNEITQYVSEPRYYTFALQNVKENLKAIYNRETVYTTYLELLMAGWETYERLLESGIECEYLKEFDARYFAETIYKRAFHMLNSYFYPEFTMYMKYPEKILNSFFVRHDNFRIRIDDMQHFVGGYYKYALHYDKIRPYLSDRFLTRIHNSNYTNRDGK